MMGSTDGSAGVVGDGKVVAVGSGLGRVYGIARLMDWPFTVGISENAWESATRQRHTTMIIIKNVMIIRKSRLMNLSISILRI